MKRALRQTLLGVSALAGLALGASAQARPQADARPNIIVILADDMGFSDLGAFGGEIRTPNLDALARDGTRFANFHATPVCAPTRAELLTGVDHHQTGIGNFPELLQYNQKGHTGYEGFLTDRVATIAERLRAAGYATAMAGKWHLGYDPRANPAARGFDISFAMLGGGHNHFGKDRATRSTLPNTGMVYTDNGHQVPTPDNFYSSDYFTDRMIAALPAGRVGKPFFGYLAFTAPHYPLQAPAEDIARYHGRYDAGYDVLRTQRLDGLKREGLVSSDVVAHPPSDSARWDSLDAPTKAVEARKMEVFAAMVDRLDQNVGRLVSALKTRGLYDNTVIVFLSDNGAEGHQLDKSVIAPEQGKRLLASGDNRLESIGSERSYVWYGPNWAEVATAPSRLYKSFPTEGGTRVVAFVHGPGIARQIERSYVSLRDIVPTLLDFARTRPGARFGGKPVLAPQGRSIRTWLRGDGPDPARQAVVANGEMFGRLYARNGRWKAVMIPPPTGPGRWELFDVLSDPGETHDLAKARPGQLAQLIRQWNAYSRAKGVVPPAVPGN